MSRLVIDLPDHVWACASGATARLMDDLTVLLMWLETPSSTRRGLLRDGFQPMPHEYQQTRRAKTPERRAS